MRNREGTGLIRCGIILLFAAAALILYNVETQRSAGTASLEVLERIAEKKPEAVMRVSETGTEDAAVAFDCIPDYILNPRMDMPEIKTEGGTYIATLRIPSLELEVPVGTEWNYPDLRKTPCRYCGSAYTDDLVICAHNYESHFGKIKSLHSGDSVFLTDMDGNIFQYEVAEMEILSPHATEQMKTGDWDLTLFTCTAGGASRIAVRCEKNIEEQWRNKHV